MEEFCCLVSVKLPLKELQLFLDKHYMKYVIYHTFNAGFGLLGDAFLMQ